MTKNNDSTNSRNEEKERFKVIPNPQGQVDIIDYVESEEKNAICIYNDLGVLPFTSALSLCDLLNGFHEENQSLKDRLNCLVDENEQQNEQAIDLILDGIMEMHDGKRDYAESIFNKAIKLLRGEVE